jgi:hypothetical protein
MSSRYYAKREEFEEISSAERMQRLNVVWPSLAPAIQICILLIVWAILGPAEAEKSGL